ncbi:unnamed protein product [Moneuplotes crassus]|uniref:Uncharacterized protein n=1 Tax=Euplotes crassus TaxID=5936 RepID=A0AAD1U5L9_EUPCR|nr:unnamed protein product [Moneuplotes crassus]
MVRRRGISQNLDFRFDKVRKINGGKKIDLKLEVCKPYTSLKSELPNHHLQSKLNFFYSPYNNSVVSGKFMTFKDLHKDIDDSWMYDMKAGQRLNISRKPMNRKGAPKNTEIFQRSSQMRTLQFTLEKSIGEDPTKTSDSFGPIRMARKMTSIRVHSHARKKVRISKYPKMINSPNIPRIKKKNSHNHKSIKNRDNDHFFKIDPVQKEGKENLPVGSNQLFRKNLNKAPYMRHSDYNVYFKKSLLKKLSVANKPIADKPTRLDKIIQEASSISSAKETDPEDNKSGNKEGPREKHKEEDKNNLPLKAYRPRLFSPQPQARRLHRHQKRILSANPSQRRRKVYPRKCFSPLSDRIKVKNREDQRNKNKIEQVKDIFTSFKRITTPTKNDKNMLYLVVSEEGVSKKKIICQGCQEKWLS